jgi:hypothetical protein
MSSYYDPITALMLARQAREEEIRGAERYRLLRSLQPARPVKPRRARRLTLRRAALAH